jgi:hypothetical protein
VLFNITKRIGGNDLHMCNSQTLVSVAVCSK